MLGRLQDNDQTHRVLAYANNLVLISEEPAEPQRQLDVVENVAGRITLRINPTKFRTLHVRTSPAGVHATTSSLARIDIQKFDEYTDVTFLG